MISWTAKGVVELTNLQENTAWHDRSLSYVEGIPCLETRLFGNPVKRPRALMLTTVELTLLLFQGFLDVSLQS
jgi:hypothetical protein